MSNAQPMSNEEKVSAEQQKSPVVVLASENKFKFETEFAKGAARQLGAVVVTVGVCLVFSLVGAVVGKKPEGGGE